jgi:peptidoglycan-N-acetylglucosamine deacetylase
VTTTIAYGIPRRGQVAGRGVRRTAGLVAAAGAGAALAQALPVATSIPPLRRQLFPALAGIGTPGHVALTFDDGPDPLSTVYFLRLLERRRVRATFFLLGRMAQRAPHLVAEIRAAGHEIGLHGHDHRCLLWRGPGETFDDLARGRDVLLAAGAEPPQWYRPPYGVLTMSAAVAATGLGLRPVLWTAWGRDWSRRATPPSVFTTVVRDLRGGGTVLLHDSDCTSAVGSWKTTLAVLPRLLDHCESHLWTVGPLRDHQLAAMPAGRLGG